MANQSGGGRWSHVEGDHLVDDSGRIRDPSEIDVDRLEQIVMLQVSALPTPAPQIDSNERWRPTWTSRLSALPAPEHRRRPLERRGSRHCLRTEHRRRAAGRQRRPHS